MLVVPIVLRGMTEKARTLIVEREVGARYASARMLRTYPSSGLQLSANIELIKLIYYQIFVILIA